MESPPREASPEISVKGPPGSANVGTLNIIGWSLHWNARDGDWKKGPRGRLLLKYLWRPPEISMESPQGTLTVFCSVCYPDIWAHCLYHPGMLKCFQKYKLQRKAALLVGHFGNESSTLDTGRAGNSLGVKFRKYTHYPFLVSAIAFQNYSSR